MPTRLEASLVHGAALLAALALYAPACTTTSVRHASSPQEDAGDAPAESEPQEASLSDAGDSEGDTGAPTISCAANETKAGCEECCAAFDPAGDRAYTATSIAITCRSENCKSACESTYCASPPSQPDATCKQCWNSVLPQKADEFFAMCNADADCASYLGCITECPTK